MLGNSKFVDQPQDGLSVPAQNTMIAAEVLGLDDPSEVPINYMEIDQPRASPHEIKVGKGKYGMACLFILIAKHRNLWDPGLEIIRLKIDDEMMATVYVFVGKEAWDKAHETKGQEHLTTWLLSLASQAEDQWVTLYPTGD